MASERPVVGLAAVDESEPDAREQRRDDEAGQRELHAVVRRAEAARDTPRQCEAADDPQRDVLPPVEIMRVIRALFALAPPQRRGPEREGERPGQRAQSG
jgi:hypothetical protein